MFMFVCACLYAQAIMTHMYPPPHMHPLPQMYPPPHVYPPPHMYPPLHMFVCTGHQDKNEVSYFCFVCVRVCMYMFVV
jgi:hypothetical protein